MQEVFEIGRTQVQKVHELDLDDFGLCQLLPALNPKALSQHPEWVPPGTTDAEGRARLSVHSWLVRHEGLILLIDTGAGNDKERPGLKPLHRLRDPYLARLAEAGVTPEAVDYVLLTHLHADHVGWNTLQSGGEWVPTFPNATVICSEREWRYGAALARGDQAEVARVREEAGLGQPVRIPTAGVYDDSLHPLEAFGQLKLVAIDGEECLPGVRFVSTPGHSIDHAAIEITSGGEVALFGGDVLHHPLEVRHTDLISMFCEFPDATRRSRLALLARAVESRAIYFSSHFPLSSVGRIARDRQGYRWSFLGA